MKDRLRSSGAALSVAILGISLGLAARPPSRAGDVRSEDEEDCEEDVFRK